MYRKLRLFLTMEIFVIVLVGAIFFFEPVQLTSTDPSSLIAANHGAKLSYDELVEQVAPASGTQLEVYWGDTGHQLVKAGAIDIEKFETLFGALNSEQRRILQGDDNDTITLGRDNIRFWTNVLWALGLTQKSKVLSKGPMVQRTDIPLANYASTAGWTLGAVSAVELFNTGQIVTLTAKQDDLVYRVAQQIFRPCCGNHTAFPDCNHGMAVLGLLELMASEGATEKELYEAALTFNSYAFTHNYITIAAYFALQDTAWDNVDARQILGPNFSSLRGSQQVAAVVGPIPGTPGPVNGCNS